MPPLTPQIVSGTVYESDGSTPLANQEVYFIDSTDKEYLGKTTTNNIGQYSVDLNNFTGWTAGNTLQAVAGKLFARYTINTLNPGNTTEMRVTFKLTLADETAGEGLVPDAGLNEIRDWLGGSSATAPIQMAWGTGTTAPASSDTTLEGEQERNAFADTVRRDKVVEFTGVLASGEANGTDITKSGLFNASSSGDLFGETRFGTIAKVSTFIVTEVDKFKVL